jgi:hypothetical protein
MPQLAQLEKATLQEIQWNKQGIAEDKKTDGSPSTAFTVQFNPASLKVNYSNQKSGGDQAKGSAVQFVGKGATKLALELWFDSTVFETSGSSGDPRDVRGDVERITALMRPQAAPGKDKGKMIPPGVRFQWGAFLFEGVMDSMDETLDFFSSTGVPLRAQVSLSLSKAEIPAGPPPNSAMGAAGQGAFQQARAGDSLQQMAARGGNPDWKGVALANGIENPRKLAAGALINLSAGISGGASIGGALRLSGSASLGVSAGANLGVSVSLGGGASVGAAAGAGIGAGVGVGGSASAGASLSAGGGASASAGADVR